MPPDRELIATMGPGNPQRLRITHDCPRRLVFPPRVFAIARYSGSLRPCRRNTRGTRRGPSPCIGPVVRSSGDSSAIPGTRRLSRWPGRRPEGNTTQQGRPGLVGRDGGQRQCRRVRPPREVPNRPACDRHPRFDPHSIRRQQHPPHPVATCSLQTSANSS